MRWTATHFQGCIYLLPGQVRWLLAMPDEDGRLQLEDGGVLDFEETIFPPPAETLDPLLDDSLFMAARWKAAGNPARLDVWPGALHAFDLYDNAYGRSARNRMHEFLDTVLDEAR